MIFTPIKTLLEQTKFDPIKWVWDFFLKKNLHYYAVRSCPFSEESIPDISGWSAARMSQYLVQNGVKEKDARVFFEQVGHS